MLTRSRFGIVVLGPGRGGTSLLTGLMDAHPQLEIHSEAFVFDYLMGRKLPVPSTPEQRVEQFMRRCAASSRKTKALWGNKITTEQLDICIEDSTKDRAWLHHQLLSDKKLVYIGRDPRSCVEAKMRRAGISKEEAIENYRRSRVWLEFLRQENKIFFLKYEALLENPEQRLISLCEFLEIPYSPIMLTGTNSDKLISDYRQKGIDRSNKELSPEAIALESDLKEELLWYQDLADSFGN